MVDAATCVRESSPSGSTSVAATGPTSIRTIERCAKIRVQTCASPARPLAAPEEIVGTRWPSAVGAVAQGHARVLCIGPTDWLVVSDTSDAAMLTRQVEATLVGCQFGVVDVSQGLVAIVIGGPHARELLSKACALDVHPRAFGPGQCARTRFAQIPVVVDCTGNGSSFDCYVSRSYLDYLTSWLADAAAEFQEP